MKRKTKAGPRLVFAVLTIGLMSFGLLQSLVLPILPTVQQHFGTSQSTVTWVLTAYLLSASVATPIVGRIGDSYGKDRVLCLTLLLLAAGCVLAALAQSIDMLIAARAVQGLGGGVLPLSFGIIRDEFPAARISGAIGAASGLMAFGAGLGAVIAGPIVTALSYQWLFWLPVIVLVPGAIAVWIFIPRSPVRYPGRINFLSALLMSAGLITLLLGISEGPKWGWFSTACLSCFGAAVVLLTGWILNELRTDHPLIDMRMLRLPPVWTTNLSAVLFGVGQFTVAGFLPIFVQTPSSAGYGFGSTLTEASLFLLPSTLGMGLFGVLSGRVSRWIGTKSGLIVGLFLTIGPFCVFAFWADYPWEIYLASAFLGAGMGLSVAAMANIVVDSVPPAQTGVASGMSANVRTIGGCIGAAVMSTIVAGNVAADQLPTADDWRNGFLFLAATAAAATAVAIFIPFTEGTRQRRTSTLIVTSAGPSAIA